MIFRDHFNALRRNDRCNAALAPQEEVRADGEGTPQAGVTVGLDDGSQATTDDEGFYYFNDLEAGTYTVTPPAPNGLIFDPPSQAVEVPPSAGGVDFTGTTATPDPYP